MTKRVLIGMGLVVALLAGFVAFRMIDGEEPVAEGRPGDACPGRGTAGLVGLDEETGRVRWTNVVGGSISKMWAGSEPVDGQAHVVIVGEDATVRTVVARSGAVDRCPDAAEPRPEDLPVPNTVDDTGASARGRAAGSVEVIEADGSLRWRVEDRGLVGSTSGAVVVRTDTDQSAIEDDCCNGAPPAISIEVLDPADGKVRWSREVPGVESVVTPDHLLMLDQFPDTTKVPGPTDSTRPPDEVRVTAYSLADGEESWRSDIPGLAWDLYQDAGTVFVPRTGDGALVLMAIDDATGELRWQVRLPEPGRGGDATEVGGVPGVAVADGVVAVGVSSTPPRGD